MCIRDRISYIFKGDGKATLNFGNCHTKGKTKVYLNNDLISSATKMENKQIDFTYTAGDTLMIKEVKMGIFIIRAMKISCNGKAAPRKLADYNEGLRGDQRISGSWDGK